MSDGAVEEETMQSEEQVQTPVHATAGTMLRQAREAARIQLPTMAATLKVPQRKLEALEADDHESFPDHVFMRALAMGMCRALHIDAEPVLALLPQRALKSLAKTGPGINETVKVRSNFKSSAAPLGSGSGSSRKIAAGVLVLLAAAAAVYFVPFHPSVDGAEGGVAGAQQSEAANHSDASDPTAAVPLGQASNSAEAETVVTEPSAEPVAHGAAPAVAPATAALTPEGATPAAAATAASASAVATPVASTGALLALKVSTGQSWVKVKDATGKVVLEKTLAKDESATAEGQVPLTVIVGNAKGTQVTVRGEPLDISTTRDNVARFEVK
ncbi:helix-turn-helix domain-containing protein [Comamonas suwonensis]|uniref:helix-turn-helix domain-containing protein n=1 Tax=Comamonas suwonensis TaxID=2606214 RepID=UPI00145E90C3|nr:helix-turn-helix domain-containing protein [Comamonas suwonensis]MBI1623536.1 helix-turn-helix domain-containing protein [Comamonas suwonensis]